MKAPRCTWCGRFFGGFGPPAQGWTPSLCGDCCDCSGPSPHRCRACGAWDVDTHDQEAPPLQSAAVQEATP